MRAKEYIAQNTDSIGHPSEVSQVLADLTPLRLDKQATDEYFNHHLSADIRRRDYLLRQELYEQGNAMQKEAPHLEDIPDELPVEIAAEVRERLFKAIAGDESFGYQRFSFLISSSCFLALSLFSRATLFRKSRSVSSSMSPSPRRTWREEDKIVQYPNIAAGVIPKVAQSKRAIFNFICYSPSLKHAIIVSTLRKKNVKFLQMSTIEHDFFISLQYERTDDNHLSEEQ